MSKLTALTRAWDYAESNGPYAAEEASMAAHVAGKPGFEEQCTTVLAICGGAPQKHEWETDETGFIMYQRNEWIRDVEHVLTERFKYPITYAGDFIVAFEAWCYAVQLAEQEDS